MQYNCYESFPYDYYEATIVSMTIISIILEAINRLKKQIRLILNSMNKVHVYIRLTSH